MRRICPMKVRKKTNVGKYTIGPHGEIYNNAPELSERTKNMIEAMMLKDALEEVLSSDVDDNKKEGEENEHTTETNGGNEVVCD